MSARRGFAALAVIISVIIAVISITGFIAFQKFSNKQSKTNQSITTNQTPPEVQEQQSDETTSLKTIRGEVKQWRSNKIHKFEFKAPNNFTSSGISESEDQKYYFNASGSDVFLNLGLMEGPGILSSLYGRTAENPICTQPLKLIEFKDRGFEVCDTILFGGGRQALFLIDVYLGGVDGLSCEPNASVYLLYNYDEFSSLMISPKLEIMKEIIKPWANFNEEDYGKVENGIFYACPKNIDSTSVKKNLEANISNIRNATNISDSDREKIKIMYNLLTTFKFLD